MVKRIGFCCQWYHHDQSLSKKQLEEIQRPFNTKATTVRWLNEHQDQADAKLDDIQEDKRRKWVCTRKPSKSNIFSW